MCDITGDGILAADGRQPPEPAKQIRHSEEIEAHAEVWKPGSAVMQVLRTPGDTGWAVNHQMWSPIETHLINTHPAQESTPLSHHRRVYSVETLAKFIQKPPSLDRCKRLKMHATLYPRKIHRVAAWCLQLYELAAFFLNRNSFRHYF